MWLWYYSCYDYISHIPNIIPEINKCTRDDIYAAVVVTKLLIIIIIIQHLYSAMVSYAGCRGACRKSPSSSEYRTVSSDINLVTLSGFNNSTFYSHLLRALFVDYELIIGDLCKLCLVTVIVRYSFCDWNSCFPRTMLVRIIIITMLMVLSLSTKLLYYHIAASGWIITGNRIQYMIHEIQ